MPFVGPDEPRYAQVAREMFERGDLVTPTLAGETWFEKPALLYWGMIGSFHLFGVSEWAARVPSGLAGILTIAAVAWLGKMIEKQAQELNGFAFISTCVAASSLGVLIFARGASFDIIITAGVAWTLVLFFAAETTTEASIRRRLLCGMYAAVGLGLLAKGLLGIVVPALVVGLYYLLRLRLPSRSLCLSLGWGIAVTSVVAGLWYAPVIRAHGWSFIDEFFLQHHFARYVSNRYRHPQPFYFYVPIMLLLALPWTLCLAAALYEERARTWRAADMETRLCAFALSWLIAPTIFFSASGSKLPGYVLPALPGAALLVGVWLTKNLRRTGGETELKNKSASDKILRLTGGGMFAIVCGGAAFATYTREAGALVCLLIAAPVVFAAIFVLLRAEQIIAAVTAITYATLLAILFVAAFAAEDAAERRSTRGLLREVAARGYTNEPLYGLYMFDRTAEFYAAHRVAYASDGEPLTLDSVGAVARVIQRAEEEPTYANSNSRPAILVMTYPDKQRDLTSNNAFDAEIVATNNEISFIRVRSKSEGEIGSGN